jgi:phosphoribosylanthranilate isomerase
MMTKIKICGIQSEDDVAVVNKYMPEYVGFVFADSKRKIRQDTAKLLRNRLDRQIKSVGVFVNSTLDIIEELCKNGVIDVIQLHGDEDLEYILKIRKFTSCEIIKAVRVRSAADIQAALPLPVDYLLLDSFVLGEQGGSGKTFSWTQIPHLEQKFFLAGGLDPLNVKEAIKVAHPDCVDVSSGVEENGIKSEKRIKKFVKQVRELDK